jgi:hypothetical protein
MAMCRWPVGHRQSANTFDDSCFLRIDMVSHRILLAYARMSHGWAPGLSRLAEPLGYAAWLCRLAVPLGCVAWRKLSKRSAAPAASSMATAWLDLFAPDHGSDGTAWHRVDEYIVLCLVPVVPPAQSSYLLRSSTAMVRAAVLWRCARDALQFRAVCVGTRHTSTHQGFDKAEIDVIREDLHAWRRLNCDRMLNAVQLEQVRSGVWADIVGIWTVRGPEFEEDYTDDSESLTD